MDIKQQFLVDAALLQATLEYLASRPFREVRRLIEALEQSQPAAQVAAQPAAKENKT